MGKTYSPQASRARQRYRSFSRRDIEFSARAQRAGPGHLTGGRGGQGDVAARIRRGVRSLTAEPRSKPPPAAGVGCRRVAEVSSRPSCPAVLVHATARGCATRLPHPLAAHVRHRPQHWHAPPSDAPNGEGCAPPPRHCRRTSLSERPDTDTVNRLLVGYSLRDL